MTERIRAVRSAMLLLVATVVACGAMAMTGCKSDAAKGIAANEGGVSSGLGSCDAYVSKVEGCFEKEAEPEGGEGGVVAEVEGGMEGGVDDERRRRDLLLRNGAQEPLCDDARLQLTRSAGGRPV